MADEREQPAASTDRAGPSPMALPLAVIGATGLGLVDPFGWDHFGPVRWFVIPAIGFWAIASNIERLPHRPAVSGGGGGRWDRWSRSGWSTSSALWGAFLLWGVAAAVLAVDPLHAWIGTPDRRFGWLTWLLCGGLFLIASTSSSADRTVVARGFAIGIVAAGGYTVVEWAGPVIDAGLAGSRLGGPFGQPAYLGAAAALATPIAAGQVAEPTGGRGWRAVAAAGTVLGGFALVMSQSRAAWLGMVVAVTAWVAVTAIANRHRAGTGPPMAPRAPGARILTPAAMAVPVAAILAIPTLRSRITSGFGDGGVVGGRIDEWQVGVRALRHAPILGYGPEGYRVVFGRYVDQQYVIDWGRDVITDRAHSGALDVALTVGVPGAVLYGALLVVVTTASIRAIVGGDPTRTGLAVGVMAYAVQQQFFFPISEVDPLFWLAAGLVVGTDRTAHPSPAGRSIARALVTGVATGLAVVVTIAGLLDLVANRFLASGLDRDQPAAALDAVDTSIALRPDSTRYRFVASRLAARDGDLQLAIRHIEDGLDLAPADPALRGEAAGLLLDRARATSGEAERTQALAEAIERIESVVADDPNNPQHLQRLGIALALNGEFEVATRVMERALTLAPNDPEPQQNLEEIRRLEAELSG